MIKVLIILQFCMVELFALHWLSYAEALDMQQKNSKIIMIDVVRTHCKYCIKMDKDVFEDEKFSHWIEERFLPVKINLDKQQLPFEIEVKMTPSFYFFDSGKNLIKMIPGSWNISDFKDLTKNIKGE